MKKRALAVMLAGALTLGAQTGVWAASDTSDQKEGELTLLMVNDWIDETGAKGEEFTKVIKQYEEENPGVEITLQGASQQDIKIFPDSSSGRRRSRHCNDGQFRTCH